MKPNKNTYCYTVIQDNQFFIDFLKPLLCTVSYRLFFLTLFFIFPICSNGQLFNADANAAPVVGLENVHIVHQEKENPIFFVSSTTIISKNAKTLFFTDGLIHMDTIFEISTEVKNAVVAKPKEKQPRIKLKTNPAAELATTEVEKNSYQSGLPAFPWNKNPLQQETFCAAVVVVSVLSPLLLKKMDRSQLYLYQAIADFQRIVVKAECDTTYSTFCVTTTFGNNSTEFSSRPPPFLRTT